jgi:hypothetical protein
VDGCGDTTVIKNPYTWTRRGVWSPRCPVTAKIAGSNPVGSAFYGGYSSVVEQEAVVLCAGVQFPLLTPLLCGPDRDQDGACAVLFSLYGVRLRGKRCCPVRGLRVPAATMTHSWVAQW